MKKLTIFLSGILVGAIMFGSAASYASYGFRNITAEFSDIKIVVEGNLVKTELEPFLINGRVYVPLRVVGEAMNKKVGWENNTVLIGTGNQSLILTNLVMPLETNVKYSHGSTLNINGTAYQRGFYVNGKDSPTGELSFYIRDKGIKEIKGSIGIDDSNPGSQPVEIAIYKDTTKIWEGTVKKGENPVPINFRIEENTNTVSFKFKNINRAKIDFIDMVANY